MALLDRVLNLFRARAFVTKDVTAGAEHDPFGHQSAYAVDSSDELNFFQPAKYTSATTRADLLGQLPLKLYRGRGDNKKEIDSGPVVDLLNHVNPFWSPNKLLQMTELALCTYGEAYWFVEPDGRGRPREIWWGHPSRSRPVLHPDEYISHYTFTPQGSVNPVRFERSEVVWFALPNVFDEFSGLSPLKASRDAAEFGRQAQHTNKLLFKQGLIGGGFIAPDDPKKIFDKEQSDAVIGAIEKRVTGKDKAHRWGFFPFSIKMHSNNGSPRDAQYLEGVNHAERQIFTTDRIPLDLFAAESRTYENLNASLTMLYELAIIPRAAFIASTINEQLLPMFSKRDRPDSVEFDISGVRVLQENESKKWAKVKEELEAGTLTVNEYRAMQGREPVEWGDAPRGAQQPAPQPETERNERNGGADHELLYEREQRRRNRHQRPVTTAVTNYLKRMQAAVLIRAAETKRDGFTAADEPFELAEWQRELLEMIRPLIIDVFRDAAEFALEDIGVSPRIFDIDQFEAIQYIEQRAQRFAKRITDTLWNELRGELGQAIGDGADAASIEETIKRVMGNKIRSTPETIARTEINGAYNGGTLEAWRQSGVVESKTWWSALSRTTRPHHARAHGQTVPLGDHFRLANGASGDAPGHTGSAEDDINCKCFMTANTREG